MCVLRGHVDQPYKAGCAADHRCILHTFPMLSRPPVLATYPLFPPYSPSLSLLSLSLSLSSYLADTDSLSEDDCEDLEEDMQFDLPLTT